MTNKLFKKVFYYIKIYISKLYKLVNKFKIRMENIDNWRDHVEINPDVLVGKPIIRGTRIGIDFILELLAQKWTINEILKNYPQLKEKDIQTALEYSAHAIKLESVYPL